MNLKSVDGAATLEGPTVCLGAEEMYSAACYAHFCKHIVKATGKEIDYEASWQAAVAADAAQARRRRLDTDDDASGPPECKVRKQTPPDAPSVEPEMEVSPQK